MTKKINKKFKKLFRNFKSFSLVELIIVIAIIAILSVAGFMTLTKWIGKSRDSRRISDLETIKKSLTVNRLDMDTSEDYPMPDPDDSGKLLTGEINGQKLAYRGTFGSGVVKELSSLTKISKDPSGQRYAYGITKDKKKFEIAAVLEGGEEVSYNFTDKIYAGEKYSVVKGNYDGAIVYTSGDNRKYIANVPSLIYNFSGEISLIDTGNIVYIVNKGRNLAYGEGYESINENFEEVLKKRYNLPESTTGLTVVNTGVEELGNSLENNSISTGVIDSLGGSKGFVEKKLEEGGVSVDSNEEEISCGDGYFLEGGECKIQWTGDGTSGSPFVYKDQSGTIKYPQSCNDILTGGETEYETANISSSVTYSGGSSSEFKNGVYQIDPQQDGSSFKVYCDMDTDSGGWTLVATIADDGNRYWTRDNQEYLYNGNEYGSINSIFLNDYQSKAWSEFKGNKVLFMDGGSKDGYLRYDGILNNEALVEKYSSGRGSSYNVGEFYADKVVGDWRQTCGNDYAMSLQRRRSESSSDMGKGFIRRSTNFGGGDSCNYDEAIGQAQRSQNSDNTHQERCWEITSESNPRDNFYRQNALSSLMVFVK